MKSDSGAGQTIIINQYATTLIRFLLVERFRQQLSKSTDILVTEVSTSLSETIGGHEISGIYGETTLRFAVLPSQNSKSQPIKKSKKT